MIVIIKKETKNSNGSFIIKIDLHTIYSICVVKFNYLDISF